MGSLVRGVVSGVGRSEIVVEGEIIRSVRLLDGASHADEPMLVPGFVDMHCHGGGGGDVPYWRHCTVHACFALSPATRHDPSTSESDQREASRLATSMRCIGNPRGQRRDRRYPSRRTVPPPGLSRRPRPGCASESRSRATRGFAGCIRWRHFDAHIAPEMDGAIEAIGWCRDNEVIAAVGHTSASAAQTRAAIDAGATVATHLCNAMAPMHHRNPGPIPVLLSDSRVTCELILTATTFILRSLGSSGA